MWWTLCPLRQIGTLPREIYDKLEAKRYVTGSKIESLKEMSARDLGALVSNPRQGAALRAEAAQLPALNLEVAAQPITRTVVRDPIYVYMYIHMRARLGSADFQPAAGRRIKGGGGAASRAESGSCRAAHHSDCRARYIYICLYI